MKPIQALTAQYMDTLPGTFLKWKTLAESPSSQRGHAGCHRLFFLFHFRSLKSALQSISCYTVEGNLGRQSRCSTGCWPHCHQKQFFLPLLCSDHDKYLGLEGIMRGDKCMVKRKKKYVFFINLIFASPQKSFPNHFSSLQEYNCLCNKTHSRKVIRTVTEKASVTSVGFDIKITK